MSAFWFKAVLFVLLSDGSVQGSFFDWLVWSEPQVAVTSNGVPLMKVPFEELAPEEKFLVEASKITGLHLSQLDTCQHKLVMKLKSSCGSLSEEDLAKLSVNLLNCQSAVEGRQEFPCSENMSLKACTRDMDAETWNAYHVIGNRARAVCYATRQQQFRALSEMTVNKLMSTVHKQISALTSLQDQQDKMTSLAVSTMNELSRGTKEVVKSHNAVRFSQTSITEEIDRNLKQLERERVAIEDMHNQFTSLMKNLQEKLDGASKQVEQQSFNREQDHKKIVTDFNELLLSASNLRQTIDESTKTVVEQNRVGVDQFKETLERLREINASITYMSEVVNDIRRHFDSKVGIVSYAIGKNGENLENIIACIFHSSTLLFVMLLSSFLQVPRTSRWLLLIASPLNLYLAVTQDYQKYSVELPVLYTCITSFVCADIIIRWIYKFSKMKRRTQNRSSTTKDQRLISSEVEDDSCSKVNDWLKGRSGSNGRNDPILSSMNGLHVNRNFGRTTLSALREEDNKSQASEKSIRSPDKLNYHFSTPTRSVGESSVSSVGKAPCLAKCRNGQSCKNSSTGESVYCRIHAAGRR